jgi:hypothetical protein
MNSWAFRAALRASARIAFGVAAVGCGGMIGSSGEPPQAQHDDGGGGVDATGVADASIAVDVATPLEASACNEPPASALLPEGLHVDAAAAITETTFDCCVAQLETVGPVEGGVEFPDAATGNPEVQACCAVVIARLDYEMTHPTSDPDASEAAILLDEQTSAPVRWGCCSVTPAEGPTCTPWGPPMPPPMPSAMTEVA